MIKHRNNKVKVFNITNIPVCHSLRGDQPLAIVLQQEKTQVYHVEPIHMDLMNLHEQKEFLSFRVENKM